jgi:hypothetical protein
MANVSRDMQADLPDIVEFFVCLLWTVKIRVSWRSTPRHTTTTHQRTVRRRALNNIPSSSSCVPLCLVVSIHPKQETPIRQLISNLESNSSYSPINQVTPNMKVAYLFLSLLMVSVHQYALAADECEGPCLFMVIAVRTCDVYLVLYQLTNVFYCTFQQYVLVPKSCFHLVDFVILPHNSLRQGHG